MSPVVALLPEGRRLVTHEPVESLAPSEKKAVPQVKGVLARLSHTSASKRGGELLEELTPQNFIEVTDPGDDSLHGYIIKKDAQSVKEHRRRQTLMSAVRAEPKRTI